jgi:hypothetical protein
VFVDVELKIDRSYLRKPMAIARPSTDCISEVKMKLGDASRIF